MKFQSTRIPFLFALLSFMLAAAPSRGYSEGQLRFAGYLLAPSDGELWSKASGLDAQLLFWGRHAGIGFTLGCGNWAVPTQSSIISNSYYAFGSAVEGSVTMTPPRLTTPWPAFSRQISRSGGMKPLRSSLAGVFSWAEQAKRNSRITN